MVPKSLILGSCPSCVALFSYLDLRQGSNGRPAKGYAYVAKQLGCSQGTLRVHMAHLEAVGLVVIESKVGPKGAHSQSHFVDMLGVGRTTMWKLIHDGRVDAVKIGGRTLITVAELERFLAEVVAERVAGEAR